MRATLVMMSSAIEPAGNFKSKAWLRGGGMPDDGGAQWAPAPGRGPGLLPSAGEILGCRPKHSNAKGVPEHQVDARVGAPTPGPRTSRGSPSPGPSTPGGAASYSREGRLVH